MDLSELQVSNDEGKAQGPRRKSSPKGGNLPSGLKLSFICLLISVLIILVVFGKFVNIDYGLIAFIDLSFNSQDTTWTTFSLVLVLENNNMPWLSMLVLLEAEFCVISSIKISQVSVFSRLSMTF